MPAREQSPEVLVVDDAIAVIDRADMQDLENRLSRSSRGRTRLCAHRSSDESLHEMLIVLSAASYIRPHRHRGKPESFHLIDGLVDIVFFDEAGGISEILEMGAYGTGRPFYYRIAEAVYHTLVLRTPTLVYHEVTLGPFNREDTTFAPWAPDEADAGAVARWREALEAQMHAFTGESRGR